MSHSISLNGPHDALLYQYLEDQIVSCRNWKNIAAAVCQVALVSLAASMAIAAILKTLTIIPIVIVLTPVLIALVIIARQRNPGPANQGLWQEVVQNKTIGGIQIDSIVYYSKLAIVAGLAYAAASTLALPILVAGASTYIVMSHKISQLKKLRDGIQQSQYPFPQVQAPSVSFSVIPSS